MPNRYFNQNSKLFKAILASRPAKAKSKNKNGEDAWFEEFVKEFYHLEPEEDLEHFASNELFAIAQGAFDFFKQRKKGEPKIRIFTPEAKNHGWESEYTIVEVINDDMPFLVDSLSEELNQQGITIYNMFHPVVGVVRDKKGCVTNLYPAKKKKNADSKESIIHFQISQITSQEGSQELEKSLNCVLKAIHFAVVDWRQILQKLDEVIAEFSLSVLNIEKATKGEKRQELEAYSQEVKAFLEWLKENNFVFLGYTAYDLERQKTGRKFEEELKKQKGSELGIFKLAGTEFKESIKKISPEGLHFVQSDSLIEITKTNKKSMVHRPVHMDYIGIKRFDHDGKVIGEHRLIGLFTSQVYYQSAPLIPLIRQKINWIHDQANFNTSGHSGKALAAVLESFPRDELLQSSAQELFDAAVGIVALGVRPRVRLFVRIDDFERFASCIIYIPRERMSTNLRGRMEEVLRSALNGTISNHYTQITEAHLARLQIIVKTTPGKIPKFDIKDLEDKLAQCAKLWEDELRDELGKRIGEKAGEDVYNIYENAFSVSYTNRFNAEDAFFDILRIEQVLKNSQTIFDVYESRKDSDHFHLKVYNPNKQIYLSEIMPILENMGLTVVAEHTYLATPNEANQDIWIHHFRFQSSVKERPEFRKLKVNFEDTITKVWNREIENDTLNNLTVSAALKWREITLLRAYVKYLKQIGFSYGIDFIQRALQLHPKLTKLVVGLFDAKFNPKFKSMTQRDEAKEVLLKEMNRLLGKVLNLAEDRVIRGLVDLVNATLRTNFYQKCSDIPGHDHKNYVSFKFNSKDIPNLPLPKPYAEIFVYSAYMEGIHLRGGKVARGGLRWSDRNEDFRTEILGLMKAQMTKNSVIVPVGSKGGFIVKTPLQGASREIFMQEGVRCYQTFLRGILDVTDNIVDGNVKTPRDVIRYDKDDPYLVVAADKGTATFSDIANQISQEYNFWLGDAFASGGSDGYDHKKMGITARGAWISVERHFREMGIDTNQEDFSVVGIGDMSGDVFGNGMLLSKHICLVGAFNHMHIFIDPAPNAAKTYKERQRLFGLKRSTWQDFNPKLISKGGGVFERSAKSIKLTKEIKVLLRVEKDSVTPDELIRLLLKARVGLIWNGGIGTYIKAENEVHSEVGDRTNDNVRVNASEVRAKVIGEGGNLGLTQLGRIEYARNGGRINTDAIDNSAGVDCSDHEVNIKILLDDVVANGKLTNAARNKLLEDMTDEIAELVLRDNKLQTQAITIAQMQSAANLEMNARLIAKFEKEGLLDRKVEFLPSEEDISRLFAAGSGLSRPELSVILGYSKMILNDEILKTKLPENPYYVKDLAIYFPKRLQKKYKKEIANHALGREIIANFTTNSMINRVGSTFFYQVAEDTGASIGEIAMAYTITRDIFDLRKFWFEIEELDGSVKAETQVELFMEIQNLVQQNVHWFLRNTEKDDDIGNVVRDYVDGVKVLKECCFKILSPTASDIYENKLEYFTKKGVPEKLSRDTASLDALASAPSIIHVAKEFKLPVDVVGKIYFELSARLKIGWIIKTLEQVKSKSYWKRLSIQTMVHDIYDQKMHLTAQVLRNKPSNVSPQNALDYWLKNKENQLARYDRFIDDLKGQENIDFAVFVVATKRIEEISQA